nr:MAG TPA: hypothetical protein [Caudoviricetes sp.]
MELLRRTIPWVRLKYLKHIWLNRECTYVYSFFIL